MIKGRQIQESVAKILENDDLYESIVSKPTVKTLLMKLRQNTEHQINNLLANIKITLGLPTKAERMEYFENVKKNVKDTFKKPLTYLENIQGLTLVYQTLEEYSDGSPRDLGLLKEIITDLEGMQNNFMKKIMKIPESYKDQVGCPFAVIHSN